MRKTILLIIILIGVQYDHVGATEPINLLGSLEKVPEYWEIVYRQPPVYPREALVKHISGCVFFSFRINSQGMPEDIQLMNSVPRGMFERAARSALKEYRWIPSTLNKQRLHVLTEALISFQMQGEKSGCTIKRDYISKPSRSKPVKPKDCKPKPGSRLLNTCS